MSILSFPDPANVLAVRGWLIEGGDADGAPDGVPHWAQALERGTDEGVSELLAAGANPNRRTQDGRGWLHWAVHTHAPDWLTEFGLSMLQDQWWAPDATGLSPFHLPELSPAVAQVMAARAWAEGLDWGQLDQPASPESVALAAGKQPLARVWRGWRRVSSPRGTE